ncbi:MAG: AsmA-like C-terminal region-containing protein [Thermoanaerobaculaceae bacterium]|nr:AsmA-like C-terminal region-containing protein [Thermoanaerobaculaceae bacterium]
MQVTVGGNTLAGRVAVDLGAERPRVVAALTAPLLDLTTLAESAAPVIEQAAGPTGATRAGRVFSTAPLALAGLAAADAQMSLSLDRLILREHADIGGVSVRALLADGRLTVEPIEVRTPGGTLTGSVRLDAKGDVSAELTGSGIGLGALATVLGGKAKATGGSADVRVVLQSKGRSLHEWAANLRGKVRIVIGPGRLDGEELDLGLGVMTKILALINPFHKKDKFTELRCAVVNVSVDRGVVDLAQRIVVATTKLSAVASGTVDLGREVLDLDVYTKASLSLSAGVSNFAGIVKVSGPLSKPSFSLAAKGAATTSLSVGAAVATVGLSLIGEDLVNKIIRRANCKDALAETVPPPESAGPPGGS